MIEDNVIRLLPAEEEAILACYVTESKERASFHMTGRPRVHTLEDKQEQAEKLFAASPIDSPKS